MKDNRLKIDAVTSYALSKPENWNSRCEWRERDAKLLPSAPYRLSVVRHDMRLPVKKVVEQFAQYFRREFAYDFTQFSATEGSEGRYVSFLFLDDGTSLMNPGKTAVGAATFRWREYTDAPPAWALQWIWLHPYRRNKGLLKEVWPYFLERFGRFYIEPPYSPAMLYFLRHYGGNTEFRDRDTGPR